MRVLLDECIDARLAKHFKGLEVRTVRDQRWSGVSNGELLALAEKHFDVFVTVDRNLAFQQHLPRFDLAVVVLHSKSNRLADLIALIPGLLAAIPEASKGVVTHVGT